MGRLILRYGGALCLLQVVAGVLVHLFYDWTWVAVALTALYVGLAVTVALALRAEGAALGRTRLTLVAVLVAVLWQLPALLGSLNLLREQWGLTPYDGSSDLLDFGMQTWQTAVMPVLALLPVESGLKDTFAVSLTGYYVGMAWAAPVLVAVVAGVTVWPPRHMRIERPQEAAAARGAAGPEVPGAWAAARRCTDAAHAGQKKPR